MLIRLRGSTLKKKLLALMSNQREPLINFSVIDGNLILQSTGAIHIESKVDTYSIEDIGGFSSISVRLDKSIELLNEKEDATITVIAMSMTIKQSSYNYVSVGEDLERHSFEFDNTLMVDKFNSGAFLNSVSLTKAMDAVGKSLSVGLPNINIKDGVAYSGYSNTILCSRIDVNDCAISSEVARRFSAVLGGNTDAKYYIDDVRGILLCSLSAHEVVGATVSRANYQVIKGIDAKFDTMKVIASVPLSSYKEIMDTVSRAFNKCRIEFTICTKGLGISVSRGNSTFSTGAFTNVLTTMSINAAQLNAISRVFGETVIDVWKGDNCLCLQQQNSDTRLLLSGMML